jgi:hypothetical protein
MGEEGENTHKKCVSHYNNIMMALLTKHTNYTDDDLCLSRRSHMSSLIYRWSCTVMMDVQITSIL